MKRVHLLLEEDVYKGIWDIVKARYVNSGKKISIVVNEALREYIEKHKESA